MASTVRTPSPRAAPSRASRSVLPLALLLVVVPFVVVAAQMAWRGGPFEFAGDQAVIGLAVHDASALSQELGPYSRYGWSHPGPSWYYAMAPWHSLFGGDDAALVAAGLLTHGLIAALLVGAVHRRSRPALTLATAGLVALLALRLPATFFLDVWNPFALLLPTAALLVLAARARDGRWTGLLALLITGSYLVQTHVGTAPLVGTVGATGLIAFVLGRRDERRAAGTATSAGLPAEERPSVAGTRTVRAPRRGWTALLGGVLLLMWIPPLVQQLTAPAGEGNLGRLLDFFLLDRQEGAHPTLGQSVIAVGRVLSVPVYGWDPGPWEMDVSRLPGAVALVLVVQLLAALGLVVAGRRWLSRGAAWTGVAVLVALVAAVASAATVTGVLYWYLLVWVGVLPGVTAIGYAQLLLDWRAGPVHARTAELASRRPVLGTLAVLLAVVSVGLGVSWSRGLNLLPASAGVQAATALVEDALEDREPGSIYVDIHSHDRWPIGAGVIEHLADDGWDVRVDSGSADLYGSERVGTGDEPVQLTLVASDDPDVATLAGALGVDLGSVATENGPLTVLLATTS